MRLGCPQFVSDLLPAEDGLYSLGLDLRRWKNAYLKERLGVGDVVSDMQRVRIAEPTDSVILPTSLYYYLIYATFGSTKLGKALSALYGMLCGGAFDLDGYGLTNLRGLYFSVTTRNTNSNSASISTINVIEAGHFFSSITGAVNVTNRNFFKPTTTGIPAGVSIQTQRGLYIPNLHASDGATNIGVDIDNQTYGTTRKLLRAKGTSQSNLEIDADDPPNLGSDVEAESAVLISFNENGTPTLRKVRWKQQNQLTTTDKVLVAA